MSELKAWDSCAHSLTLMAAICVCFASKEMHLRMHFDTWHIMSQ